MEMSQLLEGRGSALTLFVASSAYYAVFGSFLDALLVLGALLLRHSHVVLEWLAGSWDIIGAGALASIGALLGFLLLRLLRGMSAETPLWTGPGQPLLFPCKTTHSRLFPKKHSFSHSYLVVGVPVGWEGVAGGMISAEASQPRPRYLSWFPWDPSPRKGWYNVKAEDYLERGDAHLGLRGKLDAYLESQGVDPSRYPYAYLLTAAKFLGYHFNPVSFWYLYDTNKALAAMVLEVNNTFGERRMYFLTPESRPQLEGRDRRKNTASSSTTFTQSWPKDFHVSPFNSRKGSYSLRATDPLSPAMRGAGPINNTIVLRSSKQHGKIVAKLFSEGNAVDPRKLSLWQKIKFLVSWGWVGFVTFPRIVREAAVLFFGRKLHVWFRPEPLKESMARVADTTEQRLEKAFRAYLRYLVGQSSAALAVKYIPSGVPEAPKELMLSPSAKLAAGGHTEEFEFRVLTPIFYSRFVYYAHDLEALFCEFTESCTVWISRPELLPKLVMKKPPPTLHVSSPLDFIFFKAIQRLRQRPERIQRPMTWPSSSPPVSVETHSSSDIRDFRISSMDGYILAQGDARVKKSYRSSVLKLFLADRVALGSIPVLEAQYFLFRAYLAWAVAGGIDSVARLAATTAAPGPG